MSVFTKNGLGFLFVKTALSRNPQKELSKENNDLNAPSIAERIRISCEQLGPTFVKLGQILSTRTDIIPESVAKELQKLQDSVTPFSFDQARTLIETELQDTIENIYPRFHDVPVASASISQVYEAYLHSGDKVAVKVQRPNIHQNIEIDLNILTKLARFVDRHTKYGKLYDFEGMVGELRKVMEQEMNFIVEGENLDRFRENVSHRGNVTAPKVRWIYTTSKILTMDFVDGIKINDIPALDAIHADKPRIAQIFVHSLIDQILVDGFFHADPHPGNVMIIDGGKKVAFIDLGMAGVLRDRFRRQLTDLVFGIATQNTRKIAQTIMDMDTVGANVNQRRFTRSLDILLDEYLYVSLDQVNIAQVFTSVFSLAAEYHMKIPREFTLVAKSLGTAQGVVEELDPSTSILEIAEKTVKTIVLQSITSHELLNSAKATGMDLLDVFRTLPAFLLNFMRKTEDNDFSVELKIKRLDQLEKGFERISNRVSFTVILLAVCIVMAGVIIALGFQAGASKELYDLSMFALRAGLIIAIIIVVGLVFSIIHTSIKKH